MLDVTDKAVEGIQQMVKEDDKEGFFLRIYAAGMSCSGIQYAIAYDETVKEEDKKVEIKGITFLMDEFTLKDLDEAILDFIETPNGAGLYFNKPSAGGCSSCSGCN